MDQFTCSYTESSSTSSYEQQPQQNTIKSNKPSKHNSLHSVRKPLPLGKTTAKHFIAPLPPTPLKIYNVEPSDFKEVVRVLTSTPEFQYPTTRRLKGKAPPPLFLSTVPKQPLCTEPTPPPPSPPLDGEEMMSPLSTFIMSPDFCNLLNETMQTSARFTSSVPGMDCLEGWGLEPVGHDPSSGALMSQLGFGLSPASFSWCSSVLFSPGTLNPSPVL